MKSGSILKIENQLILIIEIEETKDGLIIRNKDLSKGRERVEKFSFKMLKTLPFKEVNYEFLEEKSDTYIFKIDDEIIKIEKEILKNEISFLKKHEEIVKIHKVKPVYLNYYWDNIRKGTKILLKTDTENAKILYTLDGSDPKLNGVLYHSDIVINDNLLLKVIAVKDGMEDSIIQEFQFRLKNRIIKIYLSPSRQEYNHGIEGSGYTNERIEMNKLCDKIQDNLKKYNVILYRNNPELKIQDWTREGREKQIDFHFAIHSNASSMSFKKGVENWIFDEYSKTYSIAKLMYDNLYSIYYDKKFETDRGIKYSKGWISETDPKYVDFGINLEVAYHDNMDDAKWILENMDDIALNITGSIVSYFQLELKEE